VFVSILQPTVDFLRLFYRVFLMSCGSVAYYGPVAGTAPLFASLGLLFPPDKNGHEYLEGLSNSASRSANAEAHLMRDHQAFFFESLRKSMQSDAVEQRVAEARVATVADQIATLKSSGSL
jgi:hypothetical protein